MGFTKAQLEEFRGTTVTDLVGPTVKLLFVGINPGLWTAAVQTHFARPGNRFYPALVAAGILERPVTYVDGMTPDDRTYLLERGIGITNLAHRATARADELTAQELVAGRSRLEQLVAEIRPTVVAMAGITAYRAAFGRNKAKPGRQPETLSGSILWVVPNPSGLNAHDTAASLAAAYREPAVAAGVVPA